MAKRKDEQDAPRRDAEHRKGAPAQGVAASTPAVDPNAAAVAAVHFPGLVSHPNHQLALRQQRGFGAMLSIELAGGVEAVRAFLDGLEHFTLAESLGGVESLVAPPATMTPASMSAEARAAAGIGEGLHCLLVVGPADPCPSVGIVLRAFTLT